jgi:hypothetical protein
MPFIEVHDDKSKLRNPIVLTQNSISKADSLVIPTALTAEESVSFGRRNSPDQ